MKRILSAALCACLLFALVLPCAASEPGFLDASKIDNWEQVCMLYDLGLITGRENREFDPDGYITRAEAAKIVALMMSADAESAEAAAFSDTEDHWAAVYVGYCAENGVIAGFSDGTFLPDQSVTARELTKMLLVAIGCDGDRYVGTNWASAVDTDAKELGIYNSFSGELSSYVTRDDACLLIFNALNCYAVQEDENGVRSYVTDQLLNPITVLENRYGAVRYEEYIEANEYADLSNPGTHLDEGLTKLHGHRELAASTDITMLGRWMGVVVVGNSVIGVPYFSTAEQVYTYSTYDALRAGLTKSGCTLSRDTLYYVNYVAAGAADLEDLGEHTELTAIDHEGDGEIDIVLAVSYETATVVTGGREPVLALDSALEDAEAQEAAADEPAEQTSEAAAETGADTALGATQTENTAEEAAAEMDTAESESAADSEDAAEAESADAEASEDAETGEAEQETEPDPTNITADFLFGDTNSLREGQQVWVVAVGGRYLVKYAK